MLSPVSPRRIGEWALRVLSIALLGVILVRAWKPSLSPAKGEIATQAAVGKSLPQWSVIAPTRIHLVLDSVLAPIDRDWLAAIERAGTPVTWEAAHLIGTAATLTRVADPAGASELAAAVTRHSAVVLRDSLGFLDSVTVDHAGLRLEIPGSPSGIEVSTGTSSALVAAPAAIVFKRILVEGSASWETKFTIAALAERGWKIDAITHVAPGVDVREGTPATPDTSRYAAIVAIDSTARLIARSVDTFLRQGGGFVTLRDASAVGPRSEASVVLERRSDGDVRAYHVGNGRVIRIGYKDLWRERMTDNDTVPDPVAAHRAWLARVIASVAYAPNVAVARSPAADLAADPTPLADMVDRIGARSRSLDAESPFRSEAPSSVLFGILVTSLLLELVSRRLRGAK